ncbi:D-glycero-beta-D-manno-heptose 1-phosphate adenylyltransferase [Corynebacterium halotolerans]|uniref:D-glycero-beta-D-manno-heptose 1-phosphate adenylyltransferase n=1 Tax=Corynebacterium halotolerans TaxID=225326 RepID=UPI003CEE501E
MDTTVEVVVVGDVLLDIDTVGTARRLSPDGPVPVVDVVAETPRPGGAGLAARLLKESGVTTTLVTLMGEDESSILLAGTLDGVNLVAGDSGHPTPVKKRLLAEGQVVARTDHHCAPTATAPVTEEMLAAVRSASAVLVSDYGRGLTADPDLREALREVAAKIPVVWDPHPNGADPVEGVTAVTPNLAELRAVADHGAEDTRGMSQAAAALLEQWPARSAVVTLGEKGAAVFGRGTLPQFVPAIASTSADACGAGDRFAGSLTAQLATGAPLADAVATAVQEAGSFLAGGGVATLDEEIRGESPTDDLDTRIAEVRTREGTIVATGGCFDLLHAGHARTLQAARRLGDMLIVCLNSDESVRRLKGPERPIVSQADRVELLESLECVDAVVVFDEDTPEAVLQQLRPDLWVKGGDYDMDSLPEARLVRSWGGEAVTVPYHPARSTTRLAQALNTVN